MDRRTGSLAARCGGFAALALAVAGCGGNSYLQLSSSGSPSTGVSTGGSVSVRGYSTFGTLLAIGVLAGASTASDRAHELHAPGPLPPLDATRRVHEQDCSRPIADASANLRCR